MSNYRSLQVGSKITWKTYNFTKMLFYMVRFSGIPAAGILLFLTGIFTL